MKYLVCNFKNKLTKEDIIKYNEELGRVSAKNSKLIIIPSYPFLEYFDTKGYSIGAQDITSFSDKTITGEVTGEQLKSMGCTTVLVGHSERRVYKKEINIDFINKINNAQEVGLNVIYCIGESQKEYESGYTYMVLERQISEVLNNVEIKNIMIAYEPFWSIGSGNVPKISDIKEIITYIKNIIFEKYEAKLKVLYGGSITLNNIKKLNNIKNLDGFLVGSASLEAVNVKSMIEKIEEQ